MNESNWTKPAAEDTSPVRLHELRALLNEFAALDAMAAAVTTSDPAYVDAQRGGGAA